MIKIRTARNRKSSISKKVATRSFLLFFVFFTLFTVISYTMADSLLFERERVSASQTVKKVQNRLSDANSKLTSESITELLFNETGSGDDDNEALQSNKDILNIFRLNLQVYIYDVNHKLLFGTNIPEAPPLENLDNMSDYLETKDGYVLTEEVVSQKTGKVIGYVQLFHDLTFYKTLRDRMLALLLLVEIIGTGLTLVIVFLSTKMSLKPLATLHETMTEIAQNPMDLHLRSQIKSGDEIEELSLLFDDMLDRVEHYTQAQSRFVSDVSHELRTPVAVIKGHVRLLQRWGKDDPEILEESLAAASHEAEKMSIMISDMLDMIRVQGSFDLHKGERTNPKDSIEIVLSNFRVLHEDFSFNFMTTVKDDVYVEMYRNHFEQMLIILIDNAIKYSQEVREVTVRLEASEESAIIKVMDKGEGISDEDISHIFERFYRTDKSRNRTSTKSGLGIGLSIFKQIVDAYQIEVDIESSMKEGTKFTITIPRLKDEA